ncbi:hypothetical protein KCP73_03350 [Salmonella enterica subsp. enterica]|nr:hypothetical protein KCP73_03350 [Salmonella enterica subsp. enterica]
MSIASESSLPWLARGFQCNSQGCKSVRNVKNGEQAFEIVEKVKASMG